MEIILLERIEKLGQMGDVVAVKAGYARNYLLPRGKALRATKENVERFERDRGQLEATNVTRREEAETLAGKLEGAICVLLRQASESAQLYGSVTARDIAQSIDGVTINRTQVQLDRPIKTLGIHKVRVALHPEVIIEVDVNIARSAEEAEAQAAAATGDSVPGEAAAGEDAAGEAAPETAPVPTEQGESASESEASSEAKSED